MKSKTQPITIYNWETYKQSTKDSPVSRRVKINIRIIEIVDWEYKTEI